MAYKLELPTLAAIHPIFHISQLRRAWVTAHSSSLLSQLSEDLELVVEPDVQQQHGAPGQLEVLIQWEDLPLF